jgi:hypothetical protein
MHGYVTLPTIARTQTKKRLKHVHKNPAHVWANPLQKDGSGFANTSAWNGIKNWYFKTAEDGTRILYSYRDSYVLGSRFEHKGKVIFLVREGKGYSITTTQQMNASVSAIPKRKGTLIFTVSEMVGGGWTQGKPGRNEHQRNVEAYLSNIRRNIQTSITARSSWSIESARGTATKLLLELKSYAKVFGLRLPKLPQLPKLDRKRMDTIKAKEKTRQDKRDERRRLEREAYERQHQAEVNAWLASDKACKHLDAEGKPQHSFSNRWTCEDQQEREAWARDKEELVRRWQAGENVTLKFAYSEPALLRVKDGKVETSHHAEVEIAGATGAARLWQFLLALKAAGRTYQRGNHSHHIGNFVLESFDGTNIRIGCHVINYDEAARIAPELEAACQTV